MQTRVQGLTRRSARLGVSTSDGSGSLVIGLFLLRRSHLCSAANMNKVVEPSSCFAFWCQAMLPNCSANVAEVDLISR